MEPLIDMGHTKLNLNGSMMAGAIQPDHGADV
jgi:L-cystine uptake protein TcyP (sodium:dicarboxylate symporter family)